MELFVFSLKNLTNIWAGIGAKLWAVSKPQKEGVRGITNRSQKMQIGSLGLLYCSATKTFTTPFIVYCLTLGGSKPSPLGDGFSRFECRAKVAA